MFIGLILIAVGVLALLIATGVLTGGGLPGTTKRRSRLKAKRSTFGLKKLERPYASLPRKMDPG